MSSNGDGRFSRSALIGAACVFVVFVLVGVELAFGERGDANIGLGLLAGLLLVGGLAFGVRGVRETRSGRRRGRWVAWTAVAVPVAWLLVFVVVPTIWSLFGDLPFEDW